MKGWSRPNPPRMSDTDAIVRKGTYPWTYKASGTKLPNPLVDMYAAENVFNHRSANKFSRRTGPCEEGLTVAKGVARGE